MLVIPSLCKILKHKTMAMHHLQLIVTILSVVATVMATPPAIASASSSAPPPVATSPTAAPAPAPPPTATTTSLPPGSSPPAPPTAYEMLEQYNLSRGILPEGVTGYELRPDGAFEVHLPGDCSIRVAGTPIRYSSRVAGSIQSQWIRALDGVKVKVLLTWIAISEVNRTDDQLNFFAGRISKSFPVDKFANSPQCA